MTVRPYILAATALLAVSAGCSDSTLTARDGGGNDSPDSGRRVNERKVAIELARTATREVSEGSDGEPVFGPFQPLDGADVCIEQRRDAFDFSAPFEPLEPPICVKSEAGRNVRIPDVPANSDLVITVEYEGLQPLALTERTGDRDVDAPAWAGAFQLPLLEYGALDPWLEPAPNAGPNPGYALFGAMVLADVTRVPARPGVYEEGAGTMIISSETLGPGNRPTDAVSFSVQHSGEEEPIETTSSATRWLSLPEGIARAEFRTDSDRLSCTTTGQVLGFRPGGELLGLPAGLNAVELPILAGHFQSAVLHCNCAPGPGDGELIDLPGCRFAPADPDDADAGEP